MRFRIGCFSLRRSPEFRALFGLEDYQNKIDRYRNGKPIIRLSGPIAKGKIPIEDINRDFINNPKQRKGLVDRFNRTGGLSNMQYGGVKKPRRQTKKTPSRVRNRKAVRVKMASGKNYIRMQDVAEAIPPPQLGSSSNLPPRSRSVGFAETPSNSALARSSKGAAALAGLALIAGAGGVGYLLTNRQAATGDKADGRRQKAEGKVHASRNKSSSLFYR